MDVADIPVMIIVGHVEGRRAARGSDVALPLRGAPDGAPVLLEEDAATVTKLLAVRLVPKGLKIAMQSRGLINDDPSFIVLTETKFSTWALIPKWCTAELGLLPGRHDAWS